MKPFLALAAYLPGPFAEGNAAAQCHMPLTAQQATFLGKWDMVARLVATCVLAATGAAAQNDPQPAVAALMHYTTGIANCIDAAQSPEQAQNCIGPSAQACMETEEGGFSTVGMMFCTLAEYHAWDDALNRIYGDAIDDLAAQDAEEAEFFPEYAIRVEHLRDAQRAWIPYRDATCALEYAMWGSGSFRQVAGASCLLDETAQRTIFLKFMPSRLQ